MTPVEVNELEALLRGLLKGRFSTLTIGFNHDNGPNYQSVAELVAADGKDLEVNQFDWISEEERDKAIATNSMWTLQWYRQTPNGFQAIAASSLWALINYLQSPSG